MNLFESKRIVIKVEEKSIMVYDEIAKQRIDIIPKDGNEMDKVLRIIQALLED